jgi:hypothetical protein
VIDPEQLYPGRTIPEILSVTPDTLVLTGSRAFVHPEKVDRAVLQLWNDAVGVIDTTLLPVQECRARFLPVGSSSSFDCARPMEGWRPLSACRSSIVDHSSGSTTLIFTSPI